MGRDGDEWIGGELAELVPAHAQLFAELRDVDLIARTELAYDPAQFFLGLEAAHPAVEFAIQVALLCNGGAVEAVLAAVDQATHVPVAGDDRLKRQPPQDDQPRQTAR